MAESDTSFMQIIKDASERGHRISAAIIQGIEGIAADSPAPATALTQQVTIRRLDGQVLTITDSNGYVASSAHDGITVFNPAGDRMCHISKGEEAITIASMPEPKQTSSLLDWVKVPVALLAMFTEAGLSSPAAPNAVPNLCQEAKRNR